jgi:hypothetical protein
MLRQRTCERRVARDRWENASAGQISGQVTDLAVSLTGPRTKHFPASSSGSPSSVFPA